MMVIHPCCHHGNENVPDKLVFPTRIKAISLAQASMLRRVLTP